MRYLRPASLTVLTWMALLALLVSVAAAGDDVWSPLPLPDGDQGLPEAREVVQRAIDFVESLEEFRFEALVTYEVTQAEGHKLQFDMLQRLAIHRPDRVHWFVLEDDASSSTAWLDRGSFTMIRQPANVWGRVTVPPSIPESVQRLDEEYRVDVPLVDLLAGQAAELWLGNEVETVQYIGEAWIDGTWTDHVGIRKPGVDIQLWFQQGDTPYPVKMTVVRTEDAGFPSFTARFAHWLAEVTPDDVPDFEVPEGAEELEIVPQVTLEHEETR